MQIEITCRHAPLEDVEKEYASEKIGQLKHFWPRDISSRLVVELEKFDYRVELNIHAGHSYIVVNESDRNFQAALDKAVKVAERRLRRLKGKIEKGQKRQRRLFISELRDNAGDDTLPELVELNDIELEEMTRDQARERFKSSGRNFFVYHDLELGTSAILYLKKNQTLGFIQL